MFDSIHTPISHSVNNNNPTILSAQSSLTVSLTFLLEFSPTSHSLFLTRAQLIQTEFLKTGNSTYPSRRSPYATTLNSCASLGRLGSHGRSLRRALRT